MNRFSLQLVLIAGSIAGFSVACTSPSPPIADASDDGSTGDAIVDVPDPPYNSPLFGRCRNDDDCQPGMTCKTEAASGWSGGFCTRPCTTTLDCEAGAAMGNAGFCGMHDGEQICLRECLNGYDCGRVGFTCLQYDPREPPETALRVCRPSCTDTSCQFGTRCNPWTGRCQPLSAPFPPMGQDVGESCMQTGTTNNCRSGDCVPAQNSNGAYTGWNNGYCTANCTLPPGWNRSTWWPGTRLPRGNCPEGSICFPDGDVGIAERDPGTCYRECRSDADCRVSEGYTCRRTFTRGNNRPYTWENGICVPTPCDPAPSAVNTCPSGMYCEARVRMQGSERIIVGVCRPGSRPEPTVEPGPEPAPEAGVATDANAETGSDVSPDVSSDDASMDPSSHDASMDAMG